ncbi:MAG: T9SS type A sorting domain-containing protein [bacterium]|nr:T9SS type A sorting domain-containing protein [bacterium]
MKKAYLSTIVAVVMLLGFTMTSGAQPLTTWMRTYDFGANDNAVGVIPCLDDGFIFAGNTWSTSGASNAVIGKLDGEGVLDWSRIYSAPNQTIETITHTPDGGGLLTGHIFGPGNASDALLMKINALGDSEWVKFYYLNNFSLAYSSIPTTLEPGYLIIGAIAKTNPDNFWDLLLIKTDLNGDTVWTKRFDWYVESMGLSGLETENGYVIGGRALRHGSMYRDFLICKTDLMGDTIWTCMPEYYCDAVIGGKIIPSSDGQYVLVGSMMTDLTYHHFGRLLKINTSGLLVYQSTGYLNQESGFSDIKPTLDGGYVIGGGVWDYAPDSEEGALLMKVDSNFDTVWTKTYSQSSLNGILSVQLTQDDGYISAGWTGETGVDDDVLLIKTDAAGNVPVKPEILPQPFYFTVHPPFPNPFNPTTTICFDLLQSAQVRLEVFDIQGRVVGVQHVEPLQQPGSHEIPFDGSGLPSGVYIYRLTAGELTTLGKMVLLK